MFVDVSGGAGPKNQGGTLNFSFDALESSGSNTQPTVIRLPGGTSNVIPGLSAGDVTMGNMSMKGSPTTF